MGIQLAIEHINFYIFMLWVLIMCFAAIVLQLYVLKQTERRNLLRRERKNNYE